MDKSIHYINNKKQLRAIIRKLNLNLLSIEEDELIEGLYKHIEHTRIKSYGEGLKQGRFDAEMDDYLEAKDQFDDLHKKISDEYEEMQKGAEEFHKHVSKSIEEKKKRFKEMRNSNSPYFKGFKPKMYFDTENKLK